MPSLSCGWCPQFQRFPGSPFPYSKPPIFCGLGEDVSAGHLSWTRDLECNLSRDRLSNSPFLPAILLPLEVSGVSNSQAYLGGPQHKSLQTLSREDKTETHQDPCQTPSGCAMGTNHPGPQDWKQRRWIPPSHCMSMGSARGPGHHGHLGPVLIEALSPVT